MKKVNLNEKVVSEVCNAAQSKKRKCEKYQEEFEKKSFTPFILKFNDAKESDAISKLKEVDNPKEYIVDLIREDKMTQEDFYENFIMNPQFNNYSNLSKDDQFKINVMIDRTERMLDKLEEAYPDIVDAEVFADLYMDSINEMLFVMASILESYGEVKKVDTDDFFFGHHDFSFKSCQLYDDYNGIEE